MNWQSFVLLDIFPFNKNSCEVTLPQRQAVLTYNAYLTNTEAGDYLAVLLGCLTRHEQFEQPSTPCRFAMF